MADFNQDNDDNTFVTTTTGSSAIGAFITTPVDGVEQRLESIEDKINALFDLLNGPANPGKPEGESLKDALKKEIERLRNTNDTQEAIETATASSASQLAGWASAIGNQQAHRAYTQRAIAIKEAGG